MRPLSNIRNHIDIILITLVSFIICIPSNPLILKIPTYDQGFFLYVGQRILQGALPYRDVWDHKPPFIYYINALALYISNGTLWGSWITEVLVLSLTGIIGYLFLKKYFGKIAAFMGVLLCLAYIPFLTNNGNLTEYYALPFQFMLFRLAAPTKKENRSSFIRYLVIGIISCVIFLLKPTIIGITLAIIIYLSIQYWYNRSIVYIKQLLGVAGGFFIILAPVLIYALYQNILGVMVSDIVGEGLHYSNVPAVTHVFSIIASIQVLSLIIIFGLCGVIRYINASHSPMAIMRIAIIASIMDILLVNLPGRFFSHYYISLLPTFTVLSGYFISHTITTKIVINKNQKNVLYIVAATIIIVVTLGKSYENILHLKQWNRDRAPVIEYVQAHTSPDDSILVWGYESFIYYSARRVSPTKYAFQYPLFTSGYQTSAMTQEFLSDLKKNKPVLIIDAGDDTIGQMPKIENLSQVVKLSFVYRVAPDLLAIKKYVATNYYRVAEFQPNNITIYRSLDR